jgi:hypothetical protein
MEISNRGFPRTLGIRVRHSIALNEWTEAPMAAATRLLRGILRHGVSPLRRANAGIVWVRRPGGFASPIPTASARDSLADPPASN